MGIELTMLVETVKCPRNHGLYVNNERHLMFFLLGVCGSRRARWLKKMAPLWSQLKKLMLLSGGGGLPGFNPGSSDECGLSDF